MKRANYYVSLIAALLICFGAFVTPGTASGAARADRCKDRCNAVYRRRKDECRGLRRWQKKQCEDRAKNARDECRQRCR
jgi:hypothetical protein